MHIKKYSYFAILLIAFCLTFAKIAAQTNRLNADEIGQKYDEARNFKRFGTVTIKPDFELRGEGENIDTIAFWEAPQPEETLMFVSSKKNQLVQVWEYPFIGNERSPLRHKSFGQKTQVNGVVIDQEKDLLYVTVSKPVSTVSVFSLPGGKFVREFIRGKKNLRKEPGIDLYFRPNGETWAYVSSDKIFYIYHVETGEFLNEFKPKMSVETILTDEYYGVVYVPDENKKKGVFAYKPDWTPYIKNGTNVFGANRIFQADGEGILLYTLLNDEMGDSGAGFIVVVDQKKKLTDFEFFDRRTWEHLGTLRLKGVSNTDGIASTQQALPKYPVGLFVAINNDKTTAGIGWDKVFAATGLLEIAK